VTRRMSVVVAVLALGVGIAVMAARATHRGSDGPPAAPGVTADAIPRGLPGLLDLARPADSSLDSLRPSPPQLPPAVERAVPREFAVRHAGSAQPWVALTFDDGPSRYTDQILDVLAEHHAIATFFVIGRQLAERPETIRRLADEGHSIGNHTWSHESLVRLGTAERERELRNATAAIRRHAGVTPLLYRPPYGATRPKINRLARRLGVLPVLWSVDSEDWRPRTASEIAQQVLEEAKPGAIILLHDGGGDRSATVAALPNILTGLKRKGLVPVSVPKLLEGSLPPSSGDALLDSRPARNSSRG
jgi:peptidoglycan/xylan/chitin deacetylase (PgdA/CDA1 family)